MGALTLLAPQRPAPCGSPGSGPVVGGVAREPVVRPLLLEGRGVALQGEGGVEYAGAAAARFLALHGMRRAVGAEEEFGRAGRRRLAHRPAMLLALGHRQAVRVGPQPPGEQRVAVD